MGRIAITVNITEVKKGFKPYDKNHTYPDGGYLTIRYSSLTGKMYYVKDFAVNGKLQLGVLDGSERILVQPMEYEEWEEFCKTMLGDKE